MKYFGIFDTFSIKIRFTSPSPQRLLNEILRKNIPVWGMENGENFVSFHILPHRKKHFASFKEALREGEAWEEIPWGILHLLNLFRKRIGFFIGLIFLSFSLLFSTRFLWGIKIYGNTETPSYKIREQLAEYGLCEGKPLSSLDAKDIALRFDVGHEEYVYVGINIVGTCAKVEIREREYVKEPVPSYEGAVNQVARIYGKVVRFEVLSGQIAVKKGDFVREGDLLISGIRETKSGSFYPVKAVGRVFAETSRSFSVTVPLEETVRIYGEDERKEKYLQILGFSVPLSPFGKKKNGEEVMLEITDSVTLFGYELPALIRERIFLKPSEKKEGIKVDRAEKLAYDRYVQFKRGIFAESDEILAENVTVSTDENGVTLTAELTAVENICREAPFRFTVYP